MIGHSRFFPLLKIALHGEQRWEWMSILVAQISLGLFFALSGWNKLFQEANRNSLIETMIEVGIPFPEFMSVFLASVEFFGGSILVIGFLSTVWSIAILLAIATIEIYHAIPKGLGPLDWSGWFLYLPQVMFVIMFVWLMTRGPGPQSVDHVTARKLGVAKGARS